MGTQTEVDAVLEMLVAQRRDEVQALQQREADQIARQEQAGQQRLESLKSSLPKKMLELVQATEKEDADHADVVAESTARVQAEMAATGPAERATLEDPGVGYGSLNPAGAAVGWVRPYYGTLHGSDGTVYWQGYNPGNIDAWVSSSGSGSGILGTGAASFTLYMDWWFTFRAPESRNYSQQTYIPYNGFYIVRADDGFFTSKEAKVRIDITSRGYQYNWKTPSTTNVLDISDDNINVNDRFDGYRSVYYSSLLGADQAYLLVSTSLHTYARGSGSTAQLNFSDGDANKLGIPQLYVS